jgi:branched-chain amino acid transport system permease protein
VLAQAWNIMGGFGGQFSLGHAAFVGLGAYAFAMLLLHTGVPAPLALVLATLGALPLALVSSFALFRLRGVYFSVASLALALAVQAWMVSWNVTGGTQGLNLPIERLPDERVLYGYALVIAVAVTLFVWTLTRSDFGLRIRAVRDDEDAASSVGVWAFPVKLATFAISGAIASCAGALIAMQQISIEPNSMFGMTWTTNMIVMSVVGGLGTVAGPLLGAAIYYFGLTKLLEPYPSASIFVTGALILVVIKFAPHGVCGLFDRFRLARSNGRNDAATTRPAGARAARPSS